MHGWRFCDSSERVTCFIGVYCVHCSTGGDAKATPVALFASIAVPPSANTCSFAYLIVAAKSFEALFFAARVDVLVACQGLSSGHTKTSCVGGLVGSLNVLPSANTCGFCVINQGCILNGCVSCLLEGTSDVPSHVQLTNKPLLPPTHFHHFLSHSSGWCSHQEAVSR